MTDKNPYKMEDQYQVESVVRGYHVYHNIWDVIVDEKLVCSVETDNPRDRFAVGVYKNNNIVGHQQENKRQKTFLLLAPFF